jgi:DNA-binding transcriptional LysR family regulator
VKSFATTKIASAIAPSAIRVERSIGSPPAATATHHASAAPRRAYDAAVGPHSRLNVTRLQVLHELSRRGSVAAVADAMWMTPSAVSQHLSKLERETGVRLVEKSGRGVRLTPAGGLLASHGGRVIAALDEATAALNALRTTPAGRVRVASFPSVVQHVLPGVIAALREAHPDLVVEVQDLEGAQSLDAVGLGHVDIAVVDHWGWDSGTRRGAVEVIELFDDPLVVVLPADHALARNDAVAWTQLAGEPLIIEQRSSQFAHTVATACRRAGFEPDARARVHDVGAMLALVAAGGHVCVLPRLAVPEDGLPIAARPLTPEVHRRLLAVCRDGEPELPALRAVLAALTAYRPHAAQVDAPAG